MMGGMMAHMWIWTIVDVLLVAIILNAPKAWRDTARALLVHLRHERQPEQPREIAGAERNRTGGPRKSCRKTLA